MHMGNELLSTPVQVGFGIVSAGAIGVAAGRLRQKLDTSRVPLMGVLGAFVFAAQMVNFPIGFGASGHFVGSVLLAIILGPDAALLTMASILVIQCLIFQDGGILALGCNIFNMGVIPSYLGAWIYHSIVGQSPATHGRVYLGSFLASLAVVPLGAVAAALQVSVSGISDAPLSKLLLFIVGVHILIGIGEGVITFGVLCLLSRARPELAGLRAGSEGVSVRAVVASIGIAAGVIAAFLSLVASSLPDGLEHTLEAFHIKPESVAADAFQSKIALFPDYTLRGSEAAVWTGVAGIVGTAVTLGLVYLIARVIVRKSSASRVH